MKSTIISTIWLCLVAMQTAFGQEECRDRVHLHNGSVLTGKIISYEEGGTLVMESWNGAEMRVPSVNVRKIVQRCKGDRNRLSQRPYSFSEHGWYHATSLLSLSGQSGFGMGLQHSSGFKLHRWASVGLGVGIHQFNLGGTSPAVYPVFAEMRGYISRRPISPYFAFGAGYGFSPKHKNGEVIIDGPVETWKGGWMAQGQLGYRVGNHFTVHLGIHLQRRSRAYTNGWWSSFVANDQILHKRLDIGIGILL